MFIIPDFPAFFKAGVQGLCAEASVRYRFHKKYNAAYP
jgi:hypothetical protein